jgi:drug/metabolite transporter (DMT)-like permease
VKRIALLLLIPIAGGLAEFCDIQSARRMDPLAVMVVYRVVALAIVVPFVLVSRPRFDAEGVAWEVACAVIVAVAAPAYLRAARMMSGLAISSITGVCPLIVAVLAWCWRGEVPKPLHVACCLGIIACTYGLAS